MPLINDCHKWKWTVSEDVGFTNPITGGWVGFTLRFTADFMWACKLINDATQGISDFIDQLMALWDKIRVFFGAPTVNYYVTWEWFESICITSGLSTVGENYKDDAREAIGVQKDGYFDKFIWRLDSSDTKLPFPNKAGKVWCSTNPWVCIFPGYLHWGSGKNKGDDKLDYTAKDYGIEKASGLQNWDTWDGTLGQVLLNTDFIWTCYNESETINEFVMKVAEGVNECGGDRWNLKLVEHPDDVSRLMVVDLDTTNISKKIPKIDVGTVNSIARDWGMSTDIDDTLKHSIMMGCHSNPDGIQATNKSQKVWRIYGNTITDTVIKNLQIAETCPKPALADTVNCSETKNESPDETVSWRDLKDALIDLSEDITEESVDTAKSTMNSFWASMDTDVEDHYTDKAVTIPIGFDMTIDGLSGITWGHQFAVDQIIDAKILPKGHIFMISDVSHTIDQKDWTTKVATRLILPEQDIAYTSAIGAASNYSPAIKPQTQEKSDDFEKEPEERPNEEVQENCLMDAFDKRGYTWDPMYNLIGIRRLGEDGATTNRFTDLILLWYQPHENGEPAGEPIIGGPWDATTITGHDAQKQGDQFWKGKQPKGVGVLLAGQYLLSWGTNSGHNSGKYDGKNKPWNIGGRQAQGYNNKGGLPVIRNNDGDTVWDLSGTGTHRGKGTGYNIHRGSVGKNLLKSFESIGASNTRKWTDNARNTGRERGSKVGTWSMGCQVFASQNDMHEMNNLLRPLMEASSGNARDYISYTLLTEEDVKDCPEYQDGKANFQGEQ